MNQTIEQVIPLSHVLFWAAPWGIATFVLGVLVYLAIRLDEREANASYSLSYRQGEANSMYLAVILATLAVTVISVPIALYTTLNPNEISKQEGEQIAKQYCAKRLDTKPEDIQMFSGLPSDSGEITKPSICVWDLKKVKGGTISRHKTYEVRVQFVGTAGETVKK